MPRPTKVKDAVQINLRVDPAALARADGLISHVASTTGSVGTTRTDVLRSAMMRGLREIELERAAAGGGRRRTSA